MSGSFAVFVWHIRQTLDPTEIRLRVSQCCCPATPGDTCCVSRPFKLQGEPSGTVAGGSIGMLRSWSKLTVAPAREKDTHRAVHMHDPPRTRAYLHPIRRAAPRRAAPPGVYFLYGPIGNLIIVRASGCQPQALPRWNICPIIISHNFEFRETTAACYSRVDFHNFELMKKRKNSSLSLIIKESKEKQNYLIKNINRFLFCKK